MNFAHLLLLTVIKGEKKFLKTVFVGYTNKQSLD